MPSVDEYHANQHAIVGTNIKKKWYLLMDNPSKSTHLGTLLRCAAAFQVHQVLLVGYDKFNCQGSFGSHLYLDIVVFPSWDDVRDYLRRGGDDGGNDVANNNSVDPRSNSNDSIELGGSEATRTNEKSADEEVNSSHTTNPVPIIGILGAYQGGEEIFSSDGMAVYEDMDSNVSLLPPKESAIPDNHSASCLPGRSFPANTRNFSTDVCFLLPKDTKRGLPSSQARLCSGFVHEAHMFFDNSEIPSSKNVSTAPKEPPQIILSNILDTATILSIVLHHFTAWAGYEERTFAENQKFVKDATQPNTRRRLCRVFGQHYEKKDRSEDSKALTSITRKDEMDAMLLFNVRGSDY